MISALTALPPSLRHLRDTVTSVRALALCVAWAATVVLGVPATAQDNARTQDHTHWDLLIVVHPAQATRIEGTAPLLEQAADALASEALPPALAPLQLHTLLEVARVTLGHRVDGGVPSTQLWIEGVPEIAAIEASLRGGDEITPTEDGWHHASGVSIAVTGDGITAWFGGARSELVPSAPCATCLLTLDARPAPHANDPALVGVRSIRVALDAGDASLGHAAALTIRLEREREAAAPTADAEALRAAVASLLAMPEVEALGVASALATAQVTRTDDGVVLTLPASGPAWQTLMSTLNELVEAERR